MLGQIIINADKTQVKLVANNYGKLALNSFTDDRQQLQQRESKLQDLQILKPEKEKELQLALIAAYTDLVDNIKNWEQKYLFRAPFDGKVQFLKFYTENQFVQSGEQIFTIIPIQEKIIGQAILPAHGSGKVKAGQEVIVKLDNYPYIEYGTIQGKVNSISLSAATAKTENNETDTYLVLIDFPNCPNQLTTNYGIKLAFKAEAKGSAEIITNDRRLIERLFDNLKYIVKK